jgi:hypothetical protein
MAPRKKVSQAAAVNMALLSQIVAASAANSFIYTSPSDHASLIAAGLVEINPAVLNPNGDGSIATRSTDAGNAAVAQMNAGAIAGASVRSNVPSAFVLEDAVAIPVVKRGFAKREATYPFDGMGVGQSFFIPCTLDRDDPATSLASTVAAATRRFETPVNNPDGSPKMVTAKRAQRDADGHVVKGADGKMVKVSTTVQEMARTRHFLIRSRTVADETKPGETPDVVVARLKAVRAPAAGALDAKSIVGARVWRVA